MTEYFIAFWNLENLFDVENSPTRTDKLQRTIKNELKGWTAAVLDRKLSQLSSVISRMNNGSGPDILGVCEVESRGVLDKLVQALGGHGRSYGIAHTDSKDKRGIDVAFIYDKGLFKKDKVFDFVIVKRSATRDLFQVNFVTKPAGNTLVMVGNHWPSRSGGQYESEPYRIIAGETLAYFHERIVEVHGKDAAVLAAGDFNDEPFNRSLISYAQGERTRAKVTRARTPKFLNLMWPFLGKGVGSHYFDNEPGVLDQFLASKGLLTGNSGLTVMTDTVEIVSFPDMLTGGAYPAPKRFGRPSSNNYDQNGFSDHFPISVRVREQ